MSRSARYFAPFGPGGAHAFDDATLTRLLSIALSGGGDYADLFFEYRAAGSLTFEEGITRSASATDVCAVTDATCGGFFHGIYVIKLID